MFWRMAGLSTASPVETILDKGNFTLEELLDEDETIQECKALNGRLINFLRAREHVEQLIGYIIEEAPDVSDKKRALKFPFISCEIFTCEVDVILNTLVEDEGLMNLLFSFLEPTNSHSTLLAGYFSKVVVCLLLRKTVPLMQYIQTHGDIVSKLVDLIGITSIMEVLLRLIGADEHMYLNYAEAIQWIEDTNLLEMIVEKFSSSDSPEVHANAAETLCSIPRFAPPGLAAKVTSPGFIGSLFKHALQCSRPKSVLVNSLTVCISLMEPKRLALGTLQPYTHHMMHGSSVTASPETVEGMLDSLGDLLKFLNGSSVRDLLLTTYGKLQPPLGNHRLKIVEFISVLLTVGNEAAEKKLIELGAIQRILDLFFEYPYNNFLHHHVENIIIMCLESKNRALIEHVLHECHLVGKILRAEKKVKLEASDNKPTVPSNDKSQPRIGNVGHLTRMSNKLVHLGNVDSEIQACLQENSDWTEWYTSTLSKRNAVENVYQWACGRPTALQDRNRDSDDDAYQNGDYDVAALANNLSQAFRYGIYNNDDMEARGSLERDDEDVYFDDESAEVVISSLRLGDDHESGSLYTNSDWFAFEDDIVADKGSTGSFASPSLDTEDNDIRTEISDNVNKTGGNEDLVDAAKSTTETISIEHDGGTDKPLEWVQWRESSDANPPNIHPNGGIEVESGQTDINAAEPSPTILGELVNEDKAAARLSSSERSQSTEGNSNPCITENLELTEQKEGIPRGTIVEDNNSPGS